jgi:hypothetical protein
MKAYFMSLRRMSEAGAWHGLKYGAIAPGLMGWRL